METPKYRVTAADVRTLRDKTGAGMLWCKLALQLSEGDMEKAEHLMRQGCTPSSMQAELHDRAVMERIEDLEKRVCALESGTTLERQMDE